MPRKKFIPGYLALDARLSQLGTEGELVSPLGIDLEKNRASLSYLLFRLRASIIQRSTTPEPSSEIRRGIANAYIFLRNSSFGLASPPSSSHSPSTFAGPRRSSNTSRSSFPCVLFQVVFHEKSRLLRLEICLPETLVDKIYFVRRVGPGSYAKKTRNNYLFKVDN